MAGGHCPKRISTGVDGGAASPPRATFDTRQLLTGGGRRAEEGECEDEDSSWAIRRGIEQGALKDDDMMDVRGKERTDTEFTQRSSYSVFILGDAENPAQESRPWPSTRKPSDKKHQDSINYCLLHGAWANE